MDAGIPEGYILGRRDRALLSAASLMLAKLVSSRVLRPAEVVSVAKLQHVLARLPRVTSGLEVRLGLKGPWRRAGDIKAWHWWAVSIEGELLSLSSGGWLEVRSTGGDSFTTMAWEAQPGESVLFDDYLSFLDIVPDVRPFASAVATMDFDADEYTVDVSDSDNALLDDLGEDEEDAPDPDPDAEQDDEECEDGGDAEGEGWGR